MRYFALSLIALLTLTMPADAQSKPDRISILLGSEHINATRSFQEFNPGIILTWEQQLNYSLGLYYNSYKEVSPVVSVAYDREIYPDLDVGIFLALAVYPGDGDEFRISAGDVVPFVGLQTRYKNVFLQFIPSDGENLDGLVAFGLTFSLD